MASGSSANSYKLSELAKRLGGRLEGEDREVNGLASLEESGPDDIAILLHRRYRQEAKDCPAAALVTAHSEDIETTKPQIKVKDSYEALLALGLLWAPDPLSSPALGVHPTAVVEEGVQLGADVRIGAGVFLGKGSSVGDRTVVHPLCFLGDDSHIGKDGLIYPGVIIREKCTVGDRALLHPGVVLGADGFGFTFDGNTRKKIPQIGTVVIGNDVEIGANSCVDRSTLGVTRIGNGTKLDNLVQVGHNVTIGSHTVIVSQVGMAGSTRVGNKVTMSGQVASIGHLKIGDGTVLGARTGITKDVAPGSIISGFPARPHRQDLKLQALYERLPDLFEKIQMLETEIAKLQKAKGRSASAKSASIGAKRKSRANTVRANKKLAKKPKKPRKKDRK